MIRVALTKAAVTLFSALLTDRFIINSVVILLEWLAKRTTNDVDDRLVAALKESLDKKDGKPVNLYEELRAGK